MLFLYYFYIFIFLIKEVIRNSSNLYRMLQKEYYFLIYKNLQKLYIAQRTLLIYNQIVNCKIRFLSIHR